MGGNYSMVKYFSMLVNKLVGDNINEGGGLRQAQPDRWGFDGLSLTAGDLTGSA